MKDKTSSRFLNEAMLCIIKKDIRAMTANRRMVVALAVVPLMMAVFLPSVFLLTFRFAPESGDIDQMLALLPAELRTGDPVQAVSRLLVNNILPVFFLIIPIMVSSIMAATSFVGEREKHTLETLLYCPLRISQLFRSKVLAAFFLSMAVSLASFAAMLAVVEGESLALYGAFLPLSPSWAVLLILVAPAASLVSIVLIVRNSAKAQSVEDAQQAAAFLILPIALLVVGQFTGLLLLGPALLLALGGALALVAALALRHAAASFTYESLLRAG